MSPRQDDEDLLVKYADNVLLMEGANESSGEPESEEDEAYRLSITKSPDPAAVEAPPTYCRMENGRLVGCTEADFIKREVSHLADVLDRQATARELRRTRRRKKPSYRITIKGLPESYLPILLEELNSPARHEARLRALRERQSDQ